MSETRRDELCEWCRYRRSVTVPCQCGKTMRFPGDPRPDVAGPMPDPTTIDAATLAELERLLTTVDRETAKMAAIGPGTDAWWVARVERDHAKDLLIRRLDNVALLALVAAARERDRLRAVVAEVLAAYENTSGVDEGVIGRARAALAPASPRPTRKDRRMTIYIASKTRHAERWRALRDGGCPIISTWIDEAGPGETDDMGDLWRRCVSEASLADVTVVYSEPDDVLKGALVEVGAALASGRKVVVVGTGPSISSFTNHPLVECVEELDDAFAMVAPASPAAPTTTGE
jgi:hypothetical protein